MQKADKHSVYRLLMRFGNLSAEKDGLLKKAYDFDPIPEGLDDQYHKNILGVGCQMWSEWTPTNADVERQTFPRIAAFAEVGWTTLENKDYDHFKRALKKMEKRWDDIGINYFKDSDQLEIDLKAKESEAANNK
ncbi:family 20 glycosylhydrolase [Gelidibacter salicanalis]|uniref:beta-N-acetylhexosaminidase n=1 Tax=Gelidibacter salicanalis TaxID=291193 RepID=A0A934KT26_9FLAO|nr:family 20 glycosylhydrolase [Gelidibacter salicanalis]MBJ7881525.1 family 20 glycosylhydrolase [Gelidibacter salicanalis]